MPLSRCRTRNTDFAQSKNHAPIENLAGPATGAGGEKADNPNHHRQTSHRAYLAEAAPSGADITQVTGAHLVAVTAVIALAAWLARWYGTIMASMLSTLAQIAPAPHCKSRDQTLGPSLAALGALPLLGIPT